MSDRLLKVTSWRCGSWVHHIGGCGSNFGICGLQKKGRGPREETPPSKVVTLGNLAVNAPFPRCNSDRGSFSAARLVFDPDRVEGHIFADNRAGVNSPIVRSDLNLFDCRVHLTGLRVFDLRGQFASGENIG